MVDANDNDAVFAASGTAVYARISHGKYTAGWGAAYGIADADGHSWSSGFIKQGNTTDSAATKATFTKNITIVGPNSSVGSYVSKTCQLLVDANDNDAVFAASGTVVYARISHGKYTAGYKQGQKDAWNEAADVFGAGYVVPLPAYLDAHVHIYGPAIGYNSTTVKTAEIMVDSDEPNNYVVVSTGSGSNRKVHARKYHGKYDAGWYAAHQSVNTDMQHSGDGYFSLIYPAQTAGNTSTATYNLEIDSDLGNARVLRAADSAICAIKPLGNPYADTCPSGEERTSITFYANSRKRKTSYRLAKRTNVYVSGQLRTVVQLEDLSGSYVYGRIAI